MPSASELCTCASNLPSKVPGIAIQVVYKDTNQKHRRKFGGEGKRRKRSKLNFKSTICTKHLQKDFLLFPPVLKNHSDLTCPTSLCPNLYAD